MVGEIEGRVKMCLDSCCRMTCGMRGTDEV